jgi:membrane-bound serine protease (ClpP class)
LQQIQGLSVNVQGVSQILATQGLTVVAYKPDWRYDFLETITNPNIAYILLLIGIYGLFFEFYNPGLVLPGVAGAIALLLALYAFQLLPINYVGFALLLLGISFMIVEVIISSFGVLGVGGVVAFVAGSVLLLDIHSPGYQIAWSLIAIMTTFTTLFFLILVALAVRAARRKIVTGREAMIGSEGEVQQFNNEEDVLVKIQGEIWQAHSHQPLKTGQKIRVLAVSGLILSVTPIKPKHLTEKTE